MSLPLLPRSLWTLPLLVLPREQLGEKLGGLLGSWIPLKVLDQVVAGSFLLGSLVTQEILRWVFQLCVKNLLAVKGLIQGGQ